MDILAGPHVHIFLPDGSVSMRGNEIVGVSGRVSRVLEPIVLSLADMFQSQHVPFAVVRPQKQRLYNFSGGGVAIFIGIDTFTGRKYPFGKLQVNKTSAILYQTEPLAVSRCWEMGWEYLRRALSQLSLTSVELWDYSHANLKAIRRSAASPRSGPMRCLPPKLGRRINQSSGADRVVLRHVPPGFSPALVAAATSRHHGQQDHLSHIAPTGSGSAVGGGGSDSIGSSSGSTGSSSGSSSSPPWDGRLAFLGHSQYRPAKCWTALNGSDGWAATQIVEVRAWTLSALQPLLARHLAWLNMHQHCADSSSPLEAFRLAALLSNGAAVLSELSDADDMRVYDGLVTFCNFTALRSCHASLRSQELTKRRSIGMAAAYATRSSAFAQRFAMNRLCARARCTEGVLNGMMKSATPRYYLAISESSTTP